MRVTKVNIASTAASSDLEIMDVLLEQILIETRTLVLDKMLL